MRQTLQRIFTYTRPYRAALTVSVLLLLLVIGINLFAPILARDLIDSGAWTARSAGTAGALAALYFARAAMKAASTALSHRASSYTCALIQTEVYAHMQNLPRSYYSEQQSGELLTRLTHNVDEVEALISHALPDAVSNIILAAGVTAAMFFINIPLAVITLATILPVFAVGLFQKKVRAAFSQLNQEYSEQNAMLSENLQGIREIQLFNRQPYENGRMRRKFFTVADKTIRAILWYSFLSPGIEFFTSIGQVAVIAAGGYMAAAGLLTPGDIVAFLLYIGLFYGPVAALSNTMETIQKSVAGVSRCFEVLDEPVTIQGGAIDAGRLRGEIEFCDVSFSYNAGTHILDHISLHIPAGQRLAIIGTTGAGKTTLLNLLVRLLDPQSGSIRLDGVNIRDYTLESLRENVAIVSQDVFLFSGAIYENIAYSKPGASPDEIRSAAVHACIHDFIMSLPDGYDTVIGEKGVKLSGGQRQRIAIARAVLRDAPILLLDEATSAVDEETEREIRRSVMELFHGKTVLIVTHRLASLADADRVIAIEDGRIVSG